MTDPPESPGNAGATSSIDRMLMASLREPARNRMSAWSRALEEHRSHRSFRTHGWAFSREVGFTCGCCGQEQEWRVSITSLREMLPNARDAWSRISRRSELAGNKQRKRDRKRAGVRARALLHRHLTREQRWELRATKSVTVTGQDGNAYRITEGSCNNVFLIEDGKAKYRLCAVAKLDGFKSLPVHDLMLAQKLMIENDITAYLLVANARNEETGHHFPGSALLNEAEFEKARGRLLADTGMPDTLARMLDPVPDEAIDEPENWAVSRLRNAELQRGHAHGNADAETT